jgi:uncharacterized protein (TIGR02145 family)
MKTKLVTIFYLAAIIITFVLYGCKKEEVPSLTTNDVTLISQTTAVSGGEILSEGSSSIIVKGVCWGTSIEPTINDNKTNDGNGIGGFTSNITSLNPSTTYFVRAYATNSEGTGYGLAKSLQTNAATVPVLTTTDVTSITQTTAASGGIITSDGASSIIARGVCWSTSENPTITDSKTSDGTGTGTFTSNILGLSGNTTYYVRAYSTNSVGTAYGNVVCFKTSPLLPTISSFEIASFTTKSCKIRFTVSNDGGATVTECGFCFNTSSNPSTANNKTIIGSGTGSFIGYIINLISNTTYYIRPYATNSVGTQYGSELSVKTLTPITDIEGNTYNIVSIRNQIWMAENLKTTKYNDGTAISLVTDNATWSVLTTPGYCWYNNDAATYKITYGALYNWFAVDATANGGKNVCPTGWHVPTNAEWTTLTDYLGGTNVAGGKLKETGTTHWTSPNTDATNEVGFTALPGGNRNPAGVFARIGDATDLWSSTEYSVANAWCQDLWYGGSGVYVSSIQKQFGFSVRCLKD